LVPSSFSFLKSDALLQNSGTVTLTCSMQYRWDMKSHDFQPVLTCILEKIQDRAVVTVWYWRNG